MKDLQIETIISSGCLDRDGDVIKKAKLTSIGLVKCPVNPECKIIAVKDIEKYERGKKK